MEARAGDATVELGPPKQRALLAHLLARANETVSIARLVDALWPEHPPRSAEHAIAVYVSRLRKALGDPTRVRARAGGYELRVEPIELDLERFRALVSQARACVAEDPAAAAERVGAALGLWRGRALADLGGEAAVRDLVLELDEERLQAAELRLDAELGAGRHAQLVPELERLLAEHPAREGLYRRLMLSLYRSGRQADALEVFRRARANLRRELGIDPSPELRAFEAAILRQDPSLLAESAELRGRRHLPRLETSSGSEDDVAELVEVLASGGVRLVTLTGSDGARRRALAIAAAARVAGSFRDGVWYVDLAEVADAALVEAAIARTLGLDEPRSLPQELRGKEMLLVLDPFEHVRPAATTLSELLREAPRLKLLVLADSPLRLYGEHEYEPAA
jgi:DNA-binding SARP family transcriptional activator